ncbi:radical SAM protein [Streptomyces sp. CHB9.2]|uniref:radical SAM protein n=1 Tax=Streptomyces sp. CHB9.2 TaxID=2841670 RepID=UPI002095000C|nr:radical SAM protein [Streptomyces sp. CHB9.2]MCO6704824.1 radical SAM protein [Streptomyces sp. CHB9.2]
MNLIIKPTVNCNFKCTFCSSTHLSEEAKDIVELEDIERFLVRYPETQTIIVNGGDPLMMPVRYYWEIIGMLDRLGIENCTLSFTTNLWAFWKKPEMWTELFRHERVGVTTSFQYGDKRLKGDGTPFTEIEFLKISDLFEERVGYRPDFIAVIDQDNVDSVMNTVHLAKILGVEAKINYVSASGPEVNNRGTVMGSINNFYTQADMYEQYIAIYDAGLGEFEYNTKQMARRLKHGNTTCPLSRNCDTGIRALQPGQNYYSCGSFGDDGQYPIDFEREMKGEFFTPLQEAFEIDTMKNACYECPMFNICNGCRKTVADTKRFGLTEYHCKKMKSLAPRIIEINGMQGQIEPTPYVDESVQIIARG